MHRNKHHPVLLAEVLTYLAPEEGQTYLDLTAGYGGHAKAILAKTKNSPAVLIDRDKSAIDYLKNQIKTKNVNLIHQDFLSASQKLLKDKTQFDLILADLGVSSPHLNTASRGFSFAIEGPLDMRMDQSQTLTAEQIVNGYSEKQLAQAIRSYGEEPKAKKIAKSIVRNRPVISSKELANIVTTAVRRRGKTHPATKTFQALRIEVNQELQQLEAALPLWLELLSPGGRIAIISFHSLEDRLVKKAFKEAGGQGYDATLKLLTKQPVTSDKNELFTNPRARSAKLRAAVKIKTRPQPVTSNRLGRKGTHAHAYSGKKQFPRL